MSVGAVVENSDVMFGNSVSQAKLQEERKAVQAVVERYVSTAR